MITANLRDLKRASISVYQIFEFKLNDGENPSQLTHDLISQLNGILAAATWIADHYDTEALAHYNSRLIQRFEDIAGGMVA